MEVEGWFLTELCNTHMCRQQIACILYTGAVLFWWWMVRACESRKLCLAIESSGGKSLSRCSRLIAPSCRLINLIKSRSLNGSRRVVLSLSARRRVNNLRHICVWQTSETHSARAFPATCPECTIRWKFFPLGVVFFSASRVYRARCRAWIVIEFSPPR